ncbi:MAG: UTP--glucose-1-phosphate uridylyltransferase GalU [Alphaproteobacteria bacterium]|nr:UTP--glucose-1-phosphate uridylyltransferase GalU [Alphaproteobacteria bacterium]
MAQRVRKAIFPVGGLGTRFLPATKAMPKEMLPIVDKPLIQYAVEEAAAAGIEEFIFVTGRNKHAIEDHFDRSFELEANLEQRGQGELLAAIRDCVPSDTRLAYTRQGQALGLGHAVWCARGLVGDEPFAVLLADDLIQSETPCLKQMIEAHAPLGGNLVATMEVARAHTPNYGVIAPGATRDRLIEVKGLVEKPKPDLAPSNLAVIGRYILQPEVFSHLDRQQVGAGGEIQLTDALASLIGAQPFYALRFAGRRFDCGSKIGFLEANLAFALERADLGTEFRRLLRQYADAGAR